MLLSLRILALLGCSMLLPRGAVAQSGSGRSSSFRLAWARGEGASDCLDQPALERSVRVRLGRDPFDPLSKSSIEGSIQWQAGAFHIELRVLQGGGLTLGKRSLTLATLDCSELSDAVALAVALTIDPDAAAVSPKDPVSTHGTAAESLGSAASSDAGKTARALESPHFARPAPLEPCQRSARPPLPSPPLIQGFGVSLRAASAAGLLPGLAAGVVLESGISREALAFNLGASWFAERREGSKRFAFGLSTLHAGLCWRLLDHPVGSFAACASAEVGAMYAVVHSLQPLEPGARLFAATSAGPALRVALTRNLRFEMLLQAKLPLVRPEFGIAGVPEPVFTSSPVVAVGQLGLGWVASGN